MRITTKPLTEIGIKALRQAIYENREEIKKYSFAQRKAFENQWKEIIIEHPLQHTYILKLSGALGRTYFITKRFSNSVNSAKEFTSDFQEKVTEMVTNIDTAMTKNGAQKDVDYFIEVIQ